MYLCTLCILFYFYNLTLLDLLTNLIYKEKYEPAMNSRVISPEGFVLSSDCCFSTEERFLCFFCYFLSTL